MLWVEKFTDSGTKDWVWVLRGYSRSNGKSRELSELRKDKLDNEEK